MQEVVITSCFLKKLLLFIGKRFYSLLDELIFYNLLDKPIYGLLWRLSYWESINIPSHKLKRVN